MSTYISGLFHVQTIQMFERSRHGAKINAKPHPQSMQQRVPKKKRNLMNVQDPSALRALTLTHSLRAESEGFRWPSGAKKVPKTTHK